MTSTLAWKSETLNDSIKVAAIHWIATVRRRLLQGIAYILAVTSNSWAVRACERQAMLVGFAWQPCYFDSASSALGLA